ncbi:hypothetical protein SMICM17S_05516 [Streptomyces microflavus]
MLLALGGLWSGAMLLREIGRARRRRRQRRAELLVRSPLMPGEEPGADRLVVLEGERPDASVSRDGRPEPPLCEGYPVPQGVGSSDRGRSLVSMSPMSSSSVSTRSATEVNAAIRGLWQRSGGYLSPQDEAEYQRLLVEWAAATGGNARTAV